MHTLTRRDFTRLFAVGGSAALFGRDGLAFERPPALAPAPDAATESYWLTVRQQFLMPPNVTVVNAANLCPSSIPVLEKLDAFTKRLDREPSPAFRNEMHAVKETTRRIVAQYLRATPEEILITRNTSESNNLVSNGLDLKAGDEVVVFADNHPSNLVAWREKAKRFGFTVVVIDQVNPHPGPEHYIEAYRKAITARTKLISFTHVSSTVGDVFPARELCRLAADRGVLSLVDGAQSFGVLDVNLTEMQPDFYTGSAHKWPCGPKETGVLYVNARAHAKFWPTIYSAYPGGTGLSKTHEAMGQRDEPAILAFGEALTLLQQIGPAKVEARSRELTQALIAGLKPINGLKIWTSLDPTRASTIVSFQPGSLNASKLTDALFDKDGVICASRGPGDRGGLRFSPHFYNSHAEIDRSVAAVQRFMSTGV